MKPNLISLKAATGETVFLSPYKQPLEFTKAATLAVGGKLDIKDNQFQLSSAGRAYIQAMTGSLTDADLDSLERAARFRNIQSGLRVSTLREDLLKRQLAAMVD